MNGSPAAVDWKRLLAQSRRFLLLARLDRPGDLAFLLLIELWAVWLATEGRPDWAAIWILLFATVAARAATWVADDLGAARYGASPAESLIAGGAVTALEGLVYLGALLIAAAVLISLLNWSAVFFSVVALVLLFVFPWAKRRTYMAQVHMGLSFAWAVPVGFATQGMLPGKAGWLTFIGVLLWMTAAMILQSFPRAEQDAQAGIRSLIHLVGEAAVSLAMLLQLGAVAAWWLAGRQAELGAFFTIGLVAASALLIYQWWLARTQGPLAAYRNNFWVGIAMFCAVAFHYLCRNGGS